MRKTVLFFCVLLMSSCVNQNLKDQDKKLIEETYLDLNDIASLANDIGLSYNGNFTFVLNGNKLIRKNNLNNDKDELNIPVEINFVIDLIIGKESIGFLCYNSATAFDANIEKELLWFEYDDNSPRSSRSVS